MMGTWKRALLSWGLVLTCPALVRAGGPEENPQSPWYLHDADRWWHVDGLIGAELEPDYVGSDDSEVEPSGFVRAIFKDQRGLRYSLALGEVGIVVYPGTRWALAFDLELEEGRETENPDLRGLPEGRTTLEGELTLFRRFGDGYGFVTFQPDLLGRGKGIVYFLGYGYDYLGDAGRWVISPRVDVSWGDDEHMQTEFGLTAEEAAIIGQTPYRPGGGLKSTTFGLQVQRKLGRRWRALSAVEVEWYHGKAADSPLLAVLGADVTVEATIGAYFRF